MDTFKIPIRSALAHHNDSSNIWTARKIALKAKTAEAGTLPSYTRFNRRLYHILFTFGYIQNPNQIGPGTSQRFVKYLALYEKTLVLTWGSRVGAGNEQIPTKFPLISHEIPRKLLTWGSRLEAGGSKFPRNSHEIPPKRPTKFDIQVTIRRQSGDMRRN